MTGLNARLLIMSQEVKIMNNDDFANFLNSLVSKSQSKSTEATQTASDSSIDDLDESIKNLKKMYDSFIKAGFTEDQAMQFIFAMISSIINGTL